MTDTRLIPVILSGGAGTRLWPVSRRAHPKPFMRLADGETLAEKTLRRALAVGDGDVLTVTGADHHAITEDTYIRAGADPTHMHFLLEPIGRNTAPAIAMAAHLVADRWDEQAIMLVMPADHLIADTAAFGAAVQRATQLAAEGYLVTFGIRPTRPETGYGYIRTGAPVGQEGCRVDEFVEKPDLARAERYLADGRYLWNGGIFCMAAGRVLEALARHAPEVAAAAEKTWQDTDTTAAGPVRLAAEPFAACPSISVDYALMERADRVAVVPLDVGWSDVGSWTTIAEMTDGDEFDNRVVGDAVLVDTRGTYIQSPRLVATVGVDDLVIVDTPDALLVARHDRAQQVKEVVDTLREQEHPAADAAPVEYSSWGHARLLDRSDECGVRRLAVRADATYQEPDTRSRTWTIVQGAVEFQGRTCRTGDQLHSPSGDQTSWRTRESTIVIEVTLTDHA